MRRGSESVILTTRLIIVARGFLISLLLLLLRFPTPAIVVGKPFPATSFPVIKFRKEVKPVGVHKIKGKKVLKKYCRGRFWVHARTEIGGGMKTRII